MSHVTCGHVENMHLDVCVLLNPAQPLFKCLLLSLLADPLLIVSFVTPLHSRLQSGCSGVSQQHVSHGFPCWYGSPASCSVSQRPETCLGASAKPGGEREPQSSAAFRDHAGTYQLAAERRGETSTLIPLTVH